MKKYLLFSILIVQISLFSCKSSTGDQTIPLNEPQEEPKTAVGERYTIVPNSSEIRWKGEKITKKHHGAIMVKEGYVMVENGQLTGGQVLVDMSTISDQSQTGSSKEKLEKHLKSGDFFDVPSHPYASFTITKTAKYIGEDDVNTLVYGNLTIKGITKSTQLKAKVEVKNNNIHFQAPLFSFDRAEFDIRYDSASFFDDLGDSAIYDEIGLSIKIVASK